MIFSVRVEFLAVFFKQAGQGSRTADVLMITVQAHTFFMFCVSVSPPCRSRGGGRGGRGEAGRAEDGLGGRVHPGLRAQEGPGAGLRPQNHPPSQGTPLRQILQEQTVSFKFHHQLQRKEKTHRL